MKRIPEPELILDDDQARAYSEADFSEPHQMFVELFRNEFRTEMTGTILDLRCGASDITVRFAREYPHCTMHAVDGSEAMLSQGRKRLEQEGLAGRIGLIHGRIAGACSLSAGTTALS